MAGVNTRTRRLKATRPPETTVSSTVSCWNNGLILIPPPVSTKLWAQELDRKTQMILERETLDPADFLGKNVQELVFDHVFFCSLVTQPHLLSLQGVEPHYGPQHQAGG